MRALLEIQEQLVQQATDWGEAFTRGDDRLANKINSRIARIAMKLGEDKAESESVLIPLLAHPNPSVRLMASVYALEFDIRTHQAAAVLTAIAEDRNLRLIPMMARINLSNWAKKKDAQRKD